MKFNKKIIIVCMVIFLLIIFFPKEEEFYLKPLKAIDSDGSSSQQIIQNMENGYEQVILKYYPFGFLEVEQFEQAKLLKKAEAIVEWKTYKYLGAGNIYIGYSFDGKTYEEIGPFNESSGVVQTKLDIPVNIFSDLSNLRVRFRGEDMDFATDAIAEVSIRLKAIRYKFGVFA